MDSKAHEALRLLIAAYEEHLAAVLARRGDSDVAVDDAYDALADAFDRYEAVLDVEYGETLPMLLDDVEIEEPDADDEDDADEEDDDGLDPHAEEDEDVLDDDLDDFQLR
ncbi:primosomal protein [Demequina sp. SYSU T00192]|uniref:Primosomal protein n=1 Tax=Demequina litoralis TaxID=3051660 RepID=A0ABT8G545_9MICO|nr:primosomal protein [Demequina sp. SYSU T00192]MDN4474243.1 primosomal protein [Demequina sp. SYSU T00192]